MAQAKKISELTTAGTLSGLELVVVVQDGETRQGTSEQITASVSQRFDIFQASTSADIHTLYGLTSTNAVGLAALEVRVSTVSAAVVSINAEVSLKVYRSGDFMTNTRYIEFDTSASNGLTTGKLAWNSNDATLDVGLLGDSVLQVGQETLFYAKNINASTIPDGRLVMATGVVGNSGKIEMNLADGSGAVSPEYFLGITTQDVAAGDFGYVTHFGLVRGINATGSQFGETWAEADLLYANASISGGLTNSPPAYPAFSTPIAIVVNAVSNAGSIFVRMKSGEYLQQLHDVDVSTKVSGDIIVWNSAIGAWTNSQALVSTQADVSTLNILVQALDVSAVNARLDSVSAATSVNSAAISALDVLVSANTLAITSVNAVISALDVRVSTLEVAISAIGDVSTIAALASTVVGLESQVSTLTIQVDAVSTLTSVNAAAIVATDNNVSALEVRVSAVSAVASANTVAITSVAADVSVLALQIAAVSASVSVLQLQVDAVSALISANAASIVSINDAVSALEIRVSAVSAQAAATQIQADAVSALVSALDIRVAAVSASVSALQIQIDAVSALTSVNAAAISVINAQVTLTAKTFTSATFNDGYTEEVYAVSGTTPALTPNNGSIQVWTLTGNSTPTQGTWGSGQSMTLMVDDGTSATITWTSASVSWKTDSGSAPTLNTTGYTAIVLWKVSAVLYGARIGDA